MFKKKNKNLEDKVEKKSDEDKTVKEIIQEEEKKNRKHNSRVTMVQFIFLVIVGLFIFFQLFFFVNNVIGFLFAGVFLLVIAIFMWLSAPFNNKIEHLNKILSIVIFVIGVLLILLTTIFIHTA